MGRDGKEEEKAQGVLSVGPQELHSMPQQNADLLLSSWLPDGQSWPGVLSTSTDRRQGHREGFQEEGAGAGGTVRGHARSGQAEDSKLVHREVIKAEEGSG